MAKHINLTHFFVSVYIVMVPYIIYFQAVENVARRMSTPDFSVMDRIEQDLEEELQRESKEPEKLGDM